MSRKDHAMTVDKNLTLDPENWSQIRRLGHQMIDDVMDYLETIGEQPSWKPIPEEVKHFLSGDLPEYPQDIDAVYEDFKKYVFPYTKGNIHPRFFAWVQGTGTAFGALSDLLASAMNPNVTIGEHSPMYVDQQVVNWCKQMLNFPSSASGILLSGGSMANITALTVARNYQDEKVRNAGLHAYGRQLLVYCSSETHSCVIKAAEIIGLGTLAVRVIPTDDQYRMNVEMLEKTISEDLAQGLVPMCVVGNAGTVNTGAIDPMDDIYNTCKKYQLWFHVDGAYGALCKLDERYSDALKAIEKADSLAFDLHKWLYIPYEVGCVLFKNAAAHREAFTITPNYLLQAARGLAAGPESHNNLGFELSRGFKALKVWMSLKEHGLRKYSALIAQNNRQAEYLADMISSNPHLRVMAPVGMSIVCYQFFEVGLSEDARNELNREILIQLQERGIASPSSTILGNQYCIRVCIVNHRTKREDLDLLVNKTVEIGRALVASDS